MIRLIALLTNQDRSLVTDEIESVILQKKVYHSFKNEQCHPKFLMPPNKMMEAMSVKIVKNEVWRCKQEQSASSDSLADMGVRPTILKYVYWVSILGIWDIL